MFYVLFLSYELGSVSIVKADRQVWKIETGTDHGQGQTCTKMQITDNHRKLDILPD